jgi:hypothetical protein
MIWKSGTDFPKDHAQNNGQGVMMPPPEGIALQDFTCANDGGAPCIDF